MTVTRIVDEAERRREKKARTDALRDRAMQIVIGRGRAIGNFEVAGRQYRVSEFKDDRFQITLERLRSPMIDDDRFYMLEVRFEGARVFRIRWESGCSRVVDFKPGGWEDRLATAQ